MTLKTKFTFIYTFITGILLLIFYMVVYYNLNEIRKEEFYLYLKREGIARASLLLNEQYDVNLLRELYKHTKEITDEVIVTILNKNLNIIYQDEPKNYNDIFKKFISKKDDFKEIKTNMDKKQIILFEYKFSHNLYIIIAESYDKYGYKRMAVLLQNSIIYFIFSIFFIYVIGYYFFKKAFDPFEQVINKAEKISETNLHIRLESNSKSYETSRLVNTFNSMLDRLETSFKSQNQFMSNVAHELRTPLTTILTELELAMLKDRGIEDYKKTIKNVYYDSKKIANFITNLLDFAKSKSDVSTIQFKPVRIDELLLNSKLTLQRARNDYNINISFEDEIDDDANIMVFGNEYLLKSAFINLLDNGCKFSKDRSVTVILSIRKDFLELNFIDNGIGIPEEEINSIFEPFYRGKNRNFADGSGIGLSLVKRVITIHNGDISVNSTPDQGTRFIVILPKFKEHNY